MRKRKPLYVTFDTNSYSRVARPQIARLFNKTWPLTPDRIHSMAHRTYRWYLNRCIRKGRIVAAIAELSLQAEVLPNEMRVALIVSAGRRPHGLVVPPDRASLIQSALNMGFRILRNNRIAYAAVYPLTDADWAIDRRHNRKQRLDRESAINRALNDRALEALKDFCEPLATKHRLPSDPRYATRAWIAKAQNVSLSRILWREGLAAEASAPSFYPNIDAFHSAFRKVMAEWADFDVVTGHYAYGYDILCTDDKGRTSGAIFSSTDRARLSRDFGIQFMTLEELAFDCLRRFWFPILRWSST